MCTVGVGSGSALTALFTKAKEASQIAKTPLEQQKAADAFTQPSGPQPIGGAPRPLTANTPGQVGTGLQIGR